MDGGTVWNLNVSSAIEGCLTKVDDLSKITVDILLCHAPEDLKPDTATSTLENYMRHRHIKKYRTGLTLLKF
jgi:hypothetical protein